MNVLQSEENSENVSISETESSVTSSSTSSYNRRQNSIPLANGHLLKCFEMLVSGKAKRGKCRGRKGCRANSFYYCATCFQLTDKTICFCLSCANDTNLHFS